MGNSFSPPGATRSLDVAAGGGGGGGGGAECDVGGVDALAAAEVWRRMARNMEQLEEDVDEMELEEEAELDEEDLQGAGARRRTTLYSRRSGSSLKCKLVVMNNHE